MELLKRIMRSPWGLLYLSAAILLFSNLGIGSIINSEGRWFAVAREMMQSGDFLHPTINGQPYFDKPLVSYWFICIASLFTGGVNAWSARIPSALAGLLALFCTVRIARQLFGERAALWSGWSLTTVYSFVYWGRSAEADMEQVAAIMAALAVYFAVRKQRSLPGYMLFWSICAIGAQTKGLGAIILPAGLAGLDMLFRREIVPHLNWKNLAGLLTGGLLYALPFLLESFSRGNYDANGIVLVFRENIVRVFNPWDHKDEPCWIYCKHLPRLLIPWTPVVILALIHFLKTLVHEREKITVEMRWLLAAIGFIFLLFSAARSRRVYYILPAVPFCTMLCGTYLAALPKDWTGKITTILLRIIIFLLPVAGLLALAAPCGMLPTVYDRIFPANVRVISYCRLLLMLPLFGIALFLLLLFTGKQPDERLKRSFGSFAFTLMAVFTVAVPLTGNDPAFRTERAYSEVLHFILKQIPPENIAFWGGDYTSMVYYLDLKQPAKLYNITPNSRNTRNFYSDTTDCGGLDEFRIFLDKAEREGGAVLLRRNTAEIWQTKAPDIWRKFYLPNGTLRPEVCPEPASLVQQKFGGKKMPKIMRKKMLLRIFYPAKPISGNNDNEKK